MLTAQGFCVLKHLLLMGRKCAAAGSANCWAARATTLQSHCLLHSFPAFLQSQSEGPDISRLRPDLQQQWDGPKNAHFR